MRILHLDSGREMRGGQWQSLRLHEGLLKRGHESVLLRRGETTPLRIAGRYDIVHAHDARSHTLAALFARSPLVVSRRVAFRIQSTPTSRWKYSRPRLFIAVSNYVARELVSYGIDERRVATVYDGVPLPEQVAEGELVLTLPGKGDYLARELNLHVSRDLAADLAHARALVYFSEAEGLGSAILLAQAHGVPAIARPVGGVPEIVEDGVNGVLVAEECRIAEALARITPQMGRAARANVEARFTTDHMVEGTLAAYRKALAR